MTKLEAEATALMVKIKKEINGLSRIEMCTLWRFAESGHRYFNVDLPYHIEFMKRFNELGGFSKEISKELGWKQHI